MLTMGLLASVGWLAVGLLQSEGSAVPALAAYCLIVAAVIAVRCWPWLAGRLRVSAGGLAWGAGAGALMTAATYGLFPIVARLEPGVGDEVRGLYGQLALGNLSTALPLVAVVVVGEELLWRGVLLEAVATEPRWNPRRLLQLAMASAVYAVSQAAFGSLLLVAVAFACGVAWSALRVHTGQLIAPLTSHLVWSACVLWLVPLQT